MMSDLLQDWSADGLRVYMSSHRYRDTWSHSDDELAQGERLAGRMRDAVTAAGGQGDQSDPARAAGAFAGAMNSDLDTPQALGVLAGLADDIVRDAASGMDVRESQDSLRRMAGVLGLRLDRDGPEERVTAGWSRHLARFT
jgi:cysteinyl-tRNA synthetase